MSNVPLPPHVGPDGPNLPSGPVTSPFKLPAHPEFHLVGGDGATPLPELPPVTPPNVTLALRRLQDALGNHLPRRLAQVEASAHRIRTVAGR